METTDTDIPQESDAGGRGTKLMQICEPDLADLEHMLPELMMSTMIRMTDRDRVQWRRVMNIIQSVRWNYGPPTEVHEISA